MGYWEEQQLKQMGHMDQMMVSETKPDPKYGEPALETTLENVKKTLWDVQRHTHDTQSRLDSNNKSGPTWWLKFQTKEYLELMADQLGGIEEYLTSINNVLENSAIAQKSKSPLEESIDQVTAAIEGNADKVSAEEKLESTVAGRKAEKVEKQQSSLLSQINENVIKSITENSMFKWFKENWGKLLLAGGILTLPYKYWEKLGTAWTWFKEQGWGTQLATIAAGFVGYQAGMTVLTNLPGTLKDILTTGIIFKWAKGAGMMPTLAGIGGAVVTGVGFLAIASAVGLALGKMIMDGLSAEKLKEKWGVSSFDAFFGGAFGGMESEYGKWDAAFIGSLKVGTLGAVAGGLIGGPPGAMIGLILGMAIGGIASFFGGEQIAKWSKGTRTWLSEKWKWFDKASKEEFGIPAWFDNQLKAFGEWWQSVEYPNYKEEFRQWFIKFKNGWRIFIDSFMDAVTPDFLKDKADGHIKLEKTAPKTIIDGAKTPSWLPTGQITLDDQRKNMSGWSGLSGQAKLNSQRMANMFGDLRITSGQRSQGQQAKAMMGMKSVDVYDSKWKGKLTKAERTSAPGTEERRMAVAKIMAAGFESKHKHGNAIDFSTPDAYIGRIPALRALLEDTFPGSKLIEEGNHMHLAFKPGVAPDQLSAGMNKLHEERGGGFAGAPSNFNVTHANKTVINSQPSSTVIAGDSIRKDSPDKN